MYPVPLPIHPGCNFAFWAYYTKAFAVLCGAGGGGIVGRVDLYLVIAGGMQQLKLEHTEQHYMHFSKSSCAGDEYLSFGVPRLQVAPSLCDRVLHKPINGWSLPA